jgi:UDP-N-acetylmuramyl pentapeptide phosphotransferase/UDP-N-acetylglucosamine-1-phosphate transferase
LPTPAVAAAVVALALSAAGIVALSRRRSSLPPDVPNARSLHRTPVPRAGGYAVCHGILPVALALPPAYPHGLAGWLPPWLALAAISARDDVREVPIAARLAVQAIAAGWAAGALLPGGGIVPIAGFALAIAWGANLYNFMDGSDGLAATMGVAGFGAYGVAAWSAGASSAAPYLALAAALLPFLAVNRPPARMFLGDVGAVPLGFLAAAFGGAGVVSGLWPAWFPLLVFLPFVADATLTLLRRMIARERWWQGHRAHYYQRLAQLSGGHAGTLRVYGGLIAGSAATALACRALAPAYGWPALAAWLGLVLIVFMKIDYHWRKKTKLG